MPPSPELFDVFMGGGAMALVAPKGRKYLSADALFGLVRRSFASIPDCRPRETDIAFTDALMSAFAMFSLQSPSLLAFDKERAEGNLHTIYGMERVPCDTHRREMLDPVSPKSLRPVCKRIFRQLQRGKAREERAFLDGHDLLALDGTGSFASTTMHGASCLHKVPRSGAVTYGPQMLGAAILHPDCRAVIPLMPEPIVNQDGTAKHDGARHAAKRCMAKGRQDHPHLKCIVTEDSLSANAPPIETLQDHDLRSIVGVKEGEHPLLFQRVEAAEHAGRVTYDERPDRAAGLGQRLRFVNNVPRNASTAAVRVNVIEYWETGDAKVQHCSWVTDLRVSKRHVLHLMRGGRARWKMEHETCNTLKNQGYHFEHHDGHGTKHLSVVLAIVMLLAFLVDQTQQRCCALLQAVWAQLGSKRRLWERMRALFYDYRLDARRELFAALFDGFEKPHPIFTSATS